MRKTKQEIFEIIRDWKMENGESFIDYFNDIRPTSFMFWALGRGYIDSDRLSFWESSYTNGDLEAKDH